MDQVLVHFSDFIHKEGNADRMEEKILTLYSCRMSQRDIVEQIKELYDVKISPDLVTKINKKIMSDWTKEG